MSSSLLSSDVFVQELSFPVALERQIPKNETGTRSDRIRIFIADGHALFRSSLRALLDGTGRFTVVGEATDDIVRLVSEHEPDILLLDWDMSQQGGMNILRELADSGLSVHTILLSVHRNADVAAAIQLGAKGILSHETTAESLCEGIRKVMDGQYVLGTAGISSLVGSLRNPRPRTAFETAQRKFGLTRREFEIMTWVVAGYSNMEIAEKFSLSIHTVKHHVSHIFDKAGVSNRVELGLFAVNHRITGNTP